MPEGPEVETIRMGLSAIIGLKINHVIVADHKKYNPQRHELENLKDYTIDSIIRKGKFLLWYFSDHETRIGALNHLGMTGIFYHYSEAKWKGFTDPFSEFKHFKIYFQLSDNSHLLFLDTRTFGRFHLYSINDLEQHQSILNLGPDILDQDFDVTEFIARVQGKKIKRTKEIGKVLLDYNVVAGCGNIYKSEALFRAKINPYTPSNKISKIRLRKLAKALRDVANEAMINKGTSIRDYQHVDGFSGLMQNRLLIYGRNEKECVNCKSSIKSAKQGDRTSFWCPTCQKK